MSAETAIERVLRRGTEHTRPDEDASRIAAAARRHGLPGAALTDAAADIRDLSRKPTQPLARVVWRVWGDQGATVLEQAARLLSAAAMTLALVACGGDQFGAGPGPVTDAGTADQVVQPPPDGPRGAGGAPDGDSASPGVGGGAGHGSGGQAVEAGAGGTLSDAARQADSGAGGASVVAEAGTVSPEAAPPACPLPTIDDKSLPASFVWDSYLAKYGPDCMRCTASPCGVVTLTWWPVTQAGLTVSATINYSESGSMGISIGPCGQESQCTAWKMLPQGPLTLTLERSGDGYRVSTVDMNPGTMNVGSAGGIGSCPSPLYSFLVTRPPPQDSVRESLRATLLGLTFPCGATP